MLPIVALLKITIDLGLIYSLVSLATYLSSKIIKFDDLSTEGSFAAGGAITAYLLHTGHSCWSTILLAIIAGCITGLLTGLLHTKLKLNNLISGMVVTTGIFSINLKLAGASLVINQERTFFSLLNTVKIPETATLIIINIAAMLFLYRLLMSEIGALIKTVGENQQLLLSLGKKITVYKTASLMIANSLTAFAGCLFVQYTGIFSITGSIGTLIIALAGLIIGQAIAPKHIYGVIFGALGYQAILAVTMQLQIDPVWNRLTTAILMVILIAWQNNQTEER